MASSTPRSMTGFGAASAHRGGLAVRVDIRCVNFRGLKLNIKFRPSLGVLEKEFRDAISAILPRGTIDVSGALVRPAQADEAAWAAQTEKARLAVATLRELAPALGLDGPITLRDVLLVPYFLDGLRPLDHPVTDDEWPLVAEALSMAAAQAVAMREAEGAALRTALLALLPPIERFAAAGRELSPRQGPRARAKLEARLAEMFPDGIGAGALSPRDHAALEREILFYVERSDIAEELDRLDSHLGLYRAALDGGAECGRRLEFIAQEMLREINTAAGKAADAALSALSVEAKLAVERAKEQSANLE